MMVPAAPTATHLPAAEKANAFKWAVVLGAAVGKVQMMPSLDLIRVPLLPTATTKLPLNNKAFKALEVMLVAAVQVLVSEL
jgi:uncharacterized protein YqgC (DUF456 family)